ncbi:hypothetical protein GF312_12820, partial [Candidatus Poribacteria bacterium]|nr:hypothetical protein [Candidatus Poribacteria bacterium]
MSFPVDLNEKTRSLTQQLIDFSSHHPRVDCHTHVQGDLFNFTRDKAQQNLIGSQAAGLHKYPVNVIEQAVHSGQLVRRTMMDAVPGYSWFIQLALGQGLDFDAVTSMDRRDMGKAIMTALQPSKHSERVNWLKHMFRRYNGIKAQGESFDPVNPDNFDIVYDAVSDQRNDPEFANQILKDDGISALVTSLENASHVPLKLEPGQEAETLENIDLSKGLHPEIYYMLDVHYIVCPD